ncbi:MAG: hypothetical protein AB1611_06455 [bacterium]
MITRKGSWFKISLLTFGFMVLIALPGQADDNICSLCDKSSIQMGFGSSGESHEKWYNLSPVFRLGNQFMVHTDNPWDKPDRPDIVIYASFDSRQNIKLSPQYGTCACDNQGHRATLSVSAYNLGVSSETADLAARLKADGVPQKLWSELMGPYIYRINILAPDYGQYATSLLSVSSASSYAIGRAWVDHYRMDDTERARICNYVGSVKLPGPEMEEADPNKQTTTPLAGEYGRSSPLMALIK